MNMANRNESEVHQHETLPGPGPGSNNGLPPGVRPVEQMVDAAIERIAREHGLSRIDTFDTSVATPSAGSLRTRPTRLNWKGLDVSDEFRAYAERVARGEDLPPFSGRVLAEPNPAFPWAPGAPPRAVPPVEKSRTGRTALLFGAVAVLGLLGWSVAVKVRAANAVNADFAAAATQGYTQGQLPLQPSDVLPATAVMPEVVEASLSGIDLSGLELAGSPAAPEPAVTANDVPPTAVPQPEAVPVAPPVVAQPAVPQPVVPRPAAAAAKPAPVAAKPAPSAAPAAPAERATPARPVEDEFGIMVEEAPAAAPAPVKSVLGSVGDLTRAGQGSPGNVRKEPGGESSAKGSLLVETPSF